MRMMRGITFAMLASSVLLLAGCSSPKNEDEQRVADFLDQWGGADPLEGINATMKVNVAEGIMGRCVDQDNGTGVDCHLISVQLNSFSPDEYVMTPLAFEAILENGDHVRAHYLNGPTVLLYGSYNYTLGFEFSSHHHVVSIHIGYADEYVSSAVVPYEFSPGPDASTRANVILRVDSASIVRGRCFDGFAGFGDECHVFEVTVDNTQGGELDAMSFYWSAVDSDGLVQRCFDTSGDGIASHVEAHITVRFDMPLDTDVRLTDLRYDRHFYNLYGNATIPAYGTDEF